MKNINRLGFTVISMLMSLSCYCSSDITVHVLQVGTYGNGNLYLALDQSIDEPGCSMAYIEIPVSSPAVKVVAATAVLAVANGSTVRLKTDSCFNGTPSLSGSRTAYFINNKL